MLANSDPTQKGWSVAPQVTERHHLTLVPTHPFSVGPGSNLVITLDHQSKQEHATLAAFRVSQTSDTLATEILQIPAPVLLALGRSTDLRTPTDTATVTSHHLLVATRLQPQREKLAELRKKLAELKPHTTVPVLRELASKDRRKTLIQLRGNYLNLGQEVHEGLPSSLGLASTVQRPDRLELARWLMDKRNTLTSRVVANRLWESVFGIGLVRTSEEFGSQGEPPSHPELLDYLASYFMEKGWSIKQLHRVIMLSRIYQVSSDTIADHAKIDPQNRLLWRANIRRLDFEAMRDSLLAMSGKIDRTVGGQPVNLTDEPYSYRRSVYGYIDRGNLPELMQSFDFSDPDMTNSKRATSIVPQQALFLMNSPMAVDVARRVIARAEVAGARDDLSRVVAIYRVIFQRNPKPAELQMAVKFLGLEGKTPSEGGNVGADMKLTAKIVAKRAEAKKSASGTKAIQNEGEVVDRRPLTAWETYAQALLFSNEAAYVN